MKRSQCLIYNDLINNLEDDVFFLGFKVLNYDHFYMFICTLQSKCVSNFCRETTIKNNDTKKL